MKKTVLHTPRLTVEVSVPGSAYARGRFDWTGFVSQVTLDGKHTFCGVEDYDPRRGTGGFGLCAGFESDGAFDYADIAVGERFPRIGVGLMQKNTDAGFSVFREYDIDAFDTVWNAGADRIAYHLAPKPCRGFAFEEDRLLRVEDNRIFNTVTLKNCGEKHIGAVEFNHNFLHFDDADTDENYLLEMPYSPSVCVERGTVLTEAHSTRVRLAPSGDFYYRVSRIPQNIPHSWTMSNVKTGTKVTESADFPVTEFNNWGVRNCICPEVFARIDLDPGESMTWTRCWTFDLL